MDLEEENLIADVELQEEISAEEDSTYIKMDFSLETPEERVKKVEEIIANTDTSRLTSNYLTKMADYIVFAVDKEERKKKKILTDNHMVTVNKRETSFEGLIGKLENGEDGIYNMISNDKNIIFQPKAPITEEDIENIPGMRELRAEIAKIEELSKGARGKKAYNLKKQLIEMRQSQYTLKSAYVKPLRTSNIIKSMAQLDLTEHVTIDAEGHVHSDAYVNFYEPKHISTLLCNYGKLKEETWDKFNADMKWLLIDFEGLVDRTFKEDYPLYYDLIIYKIDGKQNATIQQLLIDNHGVSHSVEYISSLWRNKIPKMIAEQAEKEYLEYYYTFIKKGKWKRCSRCGEIKLAHNIFFSKNKTSKDGYYSICKNCRNGK